MEIKLLHEDAKVPTKERNSDAGYDLYSIENITVNPGMRKVVKTGVAMSILDSVVGLIWPRSGLSVKAGIDILAGVIDSSYRGEIMVCVLNTGSYPVNIKKGDKIAQIIFQPYFNYKMEEVDELSETDRGERGFGSSGR